MSTTATQGIDARTYLAGWLQGLVSMYTADVNAIPDEKWTETFGGCSRPANELTADAVAMILWTTKAINGNPDASTYMDDIKAMTTEFANKTVAVAKLSEACNDLGVAIKSASDERLNSSVAAPWGMETPLFTLAHIAVSHIWYHDGQLNYIQCLLGDEKVHWMGG